MGRDKPIYQSYCILSFRISAFSTPELLGHKAIISEKISFGICILLFHFISCLFIYLPSIFMFILSVEEHEHGDSVCIIS